MAAVPAFLGIWLISLLVALLAALQLGDFFRASDEFPIIMLTLSIFGSLTMAVFSIVYRTARPLSALHWAALVLTALAFTPLITPGFVQRIAEHSTNPSTVGTENAHIVVELVVPALLAVLVQWALLRRRWLRSMGVEDMTRWPWVTTAVAALIILNPLGLAVLHDTVRPPSPPMFWTLTATIAGITAGVLVVMGLIECYIRGRMLRRRLAAGGTQSSGRTAARA